MTGEILEAAGFVSIVSHSVFVTLTHGFLTVTPETVVHDA